MSHRVLAAALGGLVASSCAGEIDNPEEVLAALEAAGPCEALGITDPYVELVQPTCAKAGCHGEGSELGGLSLEGELTDLVGREPSTAGCEPFVLVDSSSIADSLILRILDDDPPCSQRMPFLEPPLSPNERGCVEVWATSLVVDAQ